MGIVEDSQASSRKEALKWNRGLLASHIAWLKYLERGVEPPDWISSRRQIIANNEKRMAQDQIANDDVNASVAAKVVDELRAEDDIASGKRGAKAKKDFIKVLLDSSKQHAKDYQEKIRQLEADEKAAADYKAKREAEQSAPRPSGGSGGGSSSSSSGSGGGGMGLMATPLGMIPTFKAGGIHDPSADDEEDEDMSGNNEVEFGGMGTLPTGAGSWGSFWKKFKGVFKAASKKVATSDQIKVALNKVSPGAGDAAQKGMQLIDSAAAGNPAALAQVKGIADASKAGDANAQPAHDLLTTLNDARKEAKAEVQAAAGAVRRMMSPLVRSQPASMALATPIQPAAPSYPFGNTTYNYPYGGQPVYPGQTGYPWPQGSMNYGQPYYAPGAQGYAPGYGYSGPQGYGLTPYYSAPYGYDGSFGGYTSEQFPNEGYETGWANPPVDVGSWGSFWKKFKGIFKKVAKKVATSGMVKDALNSQYPGAGDAAQKGMKLIDSAVSGNKDALAQVKGIADAAKSGDAKAQPAHDLLTTLNDARKEVKAETVTAQAGAEAIYSMLGKYLQVTEGGKQILMKVVQVMSQPSIEVEAQTVVPGKKVWLDLDKLADGIKEKKVVWCDEKGAPVAVGHHHGGGHGGSYGMPLGAMIPWGYDPMLAYEDAMLESESPIVGALPSGEGLVGKYIKILQGGRRETGMVFRVNALRAEPSLGVQIVKGDAKEVEEGRVTWMAVSKLLGGLADKSLVLSDENGTPVAVGGGGGHHGHGGRGFRTFDPRDMYWGPRIDVDDDGQPILVGGGGHHHGGGGRGFGYGGYWGPGMWYPPMWEEVEIVTEEEVPDTQLRPAKRVIVKKEAK